MISVFPAYSVPPCFSKHFLNPAPLPCFPMPFPSLTTLRPAIALILHNVEMSQADIYYLSIQILPQSLLWSGDSLYNVVSWLLPTKESRSPLRPRWD